MKIQVKYFATLRDRAGHREEEVELEEGASVSDLKGSLSARNAQLAEALGSCLVSINHEFAFDGDPLNEGDEVAIFPPVSGGKEEELPTRFRITEEELDLNQVLASLILPTSGAACVFSGVVRAETRKGEPHRTDHLEYEAYREMAEAKMRQVAAEIRERWNEVEGIAIVQRVGRLEPGTPTVLIACSAAHRDSGVFEAARFGIDRLKEIVPIWKKEVGPNGEQWIEGSYMPDAGDRSP
jgi:molybdopterin synthase catalytic subunit